MALPFGEQLLDARRPVAVEVLARYVVDVVVRGDAVVGGDDPPARRVDYRRELLVGHVAVPLVLARPAGLRQVGTRAAADRQPADELVADVSAAVGPDHVHHGHGVLDKALDRLLAALHRAYVD